MKKLLLAILAIVMMSTNGMAYWLSGATIKNVKVEQDGHVRLALTKGSNSYSYRFNNSNTDKAKTMAAAAMTAFASDKVVTIEIVNAEIQTLYIGAIN